MSWYDKYLTVYEKPYSTDKQAVSIVRNRIRQIETAEPVVSVIAIAHNEEKRILACLWSLCDNITDYPCEFMVINNNSTDSTEEVLKDLGVKYYNESKKGPGHARQCGLDHARGKYHICIDCDTLYPPHYIETMVKALEKKDVVCAYALWSFMPSPDYSRIGMWFFETLRDIYLRLQNIKRPELNVRGMVFAFRTEDGRKEGFRKDILRGEDGSLALALKKYGKLKFVTDRKARAVTGYGTVSAAGSLMGAFKYRAVKGLKGIFSLFYSKEKYTDKKDNML